MKRVVFFLTAALSVALSCSKNPIDVSGSVTLSDEEQSHDRIVLGERLDNPYSIDNVKAAFSQLYPTKSSDQVKFTDYYVRFLPSSAEELDRLRDMGLELLDHPMDFEVLRDGDWYHDPSIDEEDITWQYAVAPSNFIFPKDIRYEIIQECFLADNARGTKAFDDVDWEQVEKKAYEISGNGAMWEECEALTKADGAVQPCGRITIVDEKYNDGQPVGVAGVKVECNVFIKFSSSYTDRDGYYKMSGKFSSRPRYRIVFRNTKDFTIGFNTILYRGSVSGLGKNDPAGVSLCVTKESERKLFRRCVVNNAAYEFITYCLAHAIPAPPAGLCMWIFDDATSSSSIMLHHGVLLPSQTQNFFAALATWIIGFFAPDVTLGTKNAETFSDIYSITVKELASAALFTKMGKSYWNNLQTYIYMDKLFGSQLYGDGRGENAGLCGVTQMYSFYLHNRCYQDRYGGSNPMLGCEYWFHPQILTYLESRGLSLHQIAQAFTPEVTDLVKLKEKLIGLYPTYKNAVNQTFERYE